MHWTNIGLLIVAGMNLGMALFIWLKNPKNKINVNLSLTIIFVGLWALGIAMLRESTVVSHAWFWSFFQNASGVLIVVPFFFFSTYFPFQNIILKKWHKILIVLSVIIMLLINFVPGWWISSIIISPPKTYYIFNRIGAAYFEIYIYFYLISAFTILIRKYLTSGGFIKIQLRYIINGLGVLAIFGSFFAVLLPFIYGNNSMNWPGPYFALFMVATLSYFVFHYRKT